MTTMQKPTLQDVHIRSADDAHKVFYAVQLGMLPKIEKRLDAHERQALRPGDVYVWEKKGPTGDAFNVSMERFTEGKSWTASRVREDFLMYFENVKSNKGRGAQKAKSSENMIVRPGEHDQFIKQTYSVYRNEPEDALPSGPSDDKRKEPRKWHLNAYFTKLTEGQLRTIDDIPELRALVVPEGTFKSARTSKVGKKGETSKPSSSSTKRTFAPFPSNYRAHQGAPAPAPSSSQHDIQPQPQQGPSTIVVDLHPVPPWPSTSMDASMLYTLPSQLPPPQPIPALPPLAKALAAPLGTVCLLPDPDDCASAPFLPDSLEAYTPAPALGLAGQGSPEPNYEYVSASPIARHANGSVHSMSPSLSDYSNASWRSIISPVSPSPSSSSSSFSSLGSPMLPSSEFPVMDNGMPYTPAPGLEQQHLGPSRVDLAPLKSLRSHPYRRCPADDRALRLLGPGAR